MTQWYELLQSQHSESQGDYQLHSEVSLGYRTRHKRKSNNEGICESTSDLTASLASVSGIIHSFNRCFLNSPGPANNILDPLP